MLETPTSPGKAVQGLRPQLQTSAQTGLALHLQYLATSFYLFDIFHTFVNVAPLDLVLHNVGLTQYSQMFLQGQFYQLSRQHGQVGQIPQQLQHLDTESYHSHDGMIQWVISKVRTI